MKDYAAMSDFEISRLVGDVLGVQWANLDENYHELCYWPELDDELRIFNPCNNQADAWPIINGNRISLYYDYAKFDECSAHFGDECGGDFDFEHSDVNPLRAAMIVFLMMKESEND